ncbi:mycothiol synthase [Leucobacter insecticola]|uniref:Mycothiol synthase n=1 Tax=Leucobacter insecticola TaxID=2714934 RepID=A0A6G8FLK4_9MICO|nr:mycothiol synthase [Leucobacter insecticola]
MRPLALSGEALLTAARELVRVAEEHDGVSPVSDQAMLAAAQGERVLRAFGRETASGVVSTRFTRSTGEGESPRSTGGAEDPVAIGIVGDGELDLVVHPDHRGHGIGSAALKQLLAHEPGTLKAWAHGENPAAEALLTRAGFAPVRSLFRMALDPALLPRDGRDPAALTPPAGFQLRTFTAGNQADIDAWVTVNAAAFATHPEQGRITAADFRLVAEEPWFNPDDLFLLAAPGGALAGSTWIKTLPTEPETPPETELYAIGIHPDYAGHGLGRFLLDVTLARMAEHHPGRVTLYVDGENERAVKMYEAAGFTVDSRSRQWERQAGARMDS